MYYTYILKSNTSGKFYIGFTNDIKRRVIEHNSGLSQSTKSGIPWKLVFYGSFEKEQVAKDFERYLKTGSGRSFSDRRLID